MSSDPFDTLLARAQALAELGRHRQALPLLAQALALRPQELRATCWMALCLIELKQPEQALEVLNAVLGAGDSWPFRLRAVALTRLRRLDEAVDAAREAVRIAPNLFATHLAHAHALLAQGKPHEALAAAEEACRLAPNSREASLCRANALFGLERWEQAEAAYRATIALAPDWHAAHNDLGRLLFRRQRPIAAARAFLRALRLNPAESVALNNLVVTASRNRKGLLELAASLLIATIAPFDFGLLGKLFIPVAVGLLAIEGFVTWQMRRVLPPEVRRAVARGQRWSRGDTLSVGVFALLAIGMAVLRFSPTPPSTVPEQAKARAAELARCLPAGYRPAMPEVRLTLRVLASGQVDHAAAGRWLPQAAQRCMTDRMLRWRFSPPPPTPQDVSVELPLR